MMRGPARIAQGLLTDPQKPIVFRFDGRRLRGLAGDTLASALLANGERLVGRSLKYHRPRGIVTAGPEEPCALVEILSRHGREPNRPATTLELHEGLEVESQNRWPSLRFDVMAVNDLLGRFLPAGFYYKTFMAPGRAWERIYEPLLRRAAGLGRLRGNGDTNHAPAETVHDHLDVLVVGAGAAGLAATQRLGQRGLRVMLVDEDLVLGGGLLLDERWSAWREATLTALTGMASVRCLPRTTVVGAYGQGTYGALQTLTPAESARCDGLRERLRVIRARATILTTGATERLIAFAGNDVPGVMLAGAAHKLLRRYGVAAGRRPVFFLNTDQAYEAVYAFAAAGIKCSAVIDVRGASPGAERARALGIEVVLGATVEAVDGRAGVRGVRIAHGDGRPRRKLEADCLLISGGYTPNTALASQLLGVLQWREEIAAHVAALAPSAAQMAGAARGVFGFAAAARDGESAALTTAAQLGVELGATAGDSSFPVDPDHAWIGPVWEVPGRGKAFVDLQNDVTCEDVRLAAREGYEHVEHMKRYTTHGMATDQGRIGGLLGSAVLAQARGVSVAEVGQAKPRPYLQPVPFAALAGAEVGAHFKLKRRLPLHDWHEAAGATFANIGLWLRPLVYSQQPGWESVLREARAVRTAVGIADLSTLGKIDVQGPDAAKFLDFVYANTFSTLRVGGARYGIMLREDGLLLDDGTTSRLGAEHYLITTTTANAAVVLEHLEFHLQSVCPQFQVALTEVGDQWAQFAVAGPRSRDVVAAVVTGLDLSNAAFPFMSAALAQIAGIAGRVYRISFSGELAYELAVPAQFARAAWTALLEAGARFGIVPYGLDALNTLRIEKGHVTAAELNGNTSADDLGLQRLLKRQGDFVGRALCQRPGLNAPDRLQLVGVRAIESGGRLRNGAQLLRPGGGGSSLGYLTSVSPAAALDGWVGLALLAAGRARLGQRLVAASPAHGEHTDILVVSAHMFDPENLRVRA
jgi:heterotetrameric sarcosine oxidase alpha subunit